MSLRRIFRRIKPQPAGPDVPASVVDETPETPTNTSTSPDAPSTPGPSLPTPTPGHSDQPRTPGPPRPANSINVVQIKRCVTNILWLYDLDNIELFCKNRKPESDDEAFSFEQRDHFRLEMPLDKVNAVQLPTGDLRKRLAAELQINSWSRIRLIIDDRELEDARTLQEESQVLGWIPYIVSSLSALTSQAPVSATLRIEIQPEEIVRECIVCMEEHPVEEFPDKIAAQCQHVSGVCRESLQKSIISNLESRDWDKIRCMECGANLEHGDMKAHLSRADFERQAHTPNIPQPHTN